MEMTVIDARRVWTRMSLPLALLPLAATLWTACRDTGRLTGPTDADLMLVVSDPADVVPQPAGGIGALRSMVGAATADVAYVSLPPGTLGEATSATVRNANTHAQSTVAVIDGGFDPVGIAAAAGDTIEFQALGSVGESRGLVGPVLRHRQ